MDVIEVAVEPKTQNDSELLDAALNRLRQSQTWIGIRIDRESGQTILSGKSEQALEGAISALVEESRVNVGQPQVIYRETLSKPVTVLYTCKKQAGAAGQFAEVKIAFEPLPSGAGFQFESNVVGGTVPENYVPAVEKGLRSEKEDGLLVGFPVVDFKATLVDGKYHEMDSNALTFEIAARAAFRELAKRSALILLEPIMKVEVLTPNNCFGGVIGDLNARRARVLGLDALGDGQVISAEVPMSHMLGYSAALRAATDGRGRYSMTYGHHGPVQQPDGDDPRFPGAAAMRA